jgi:phospholipid/cholesterol/gamma-HCH transport system substrate-binding protein
MKTSRFAWKVGIFVFLGLVMLAVLMLQFSKGSSLFASTYELRLLTRNVGAIKPHAAVLMAGIQVGSVVDAELNKNMRSVTVFTKILTKYRIPKNSSFVIDQSGFLGDQFVSITPPATNVGPVLALTGAVVECDEPFNLQDAARSAAVLMQRLDKTAQIVNNAIERVDRVLLAEQNLVILTNTLDNLKKLSKEAITAVDQFNELLATNRDPIHLSISNVTVFSERLNRLGTDLHALVVTNRPALSTTISNLSEASGRANQLLSGLQAGNGLAGGVLKDEQMRGQFTLMISNLTLLSSNLNRYGLLYKPRPVKSSSASRGKLPMGRNPLD